MPYVTKLRLIVTNDNRLDFTHVIEALGLGQPSRVWRKGERANARTPRLRADDGIVYHVFEGVSDDCDPISEAESLIDRIEAGGEAAKAALMTNPAELSITLRLYAGGPDDPMDTPPFHLSKQFIERLYHLGLDVDLDIYIFHGSVTDT